MSVLKPSRVSFTTFSRVALSSMLAIVARTQSVSPLRTHFLSSRHFCSSREGPSDSEASTPLAPLEPAPSVFTAEAGLDLVPLEATTSPWSALSAEVSMESESDDFFFSASDADVDPVAPPPEIADAVEALAPAAVEAEESALVAEVVFPLLIGAEDDGASPLLLLLASAAAADQDDEASAADELALVPSAELADVAGKLEGTFSVLRSLPMLVTRGAGAGADSPPFTSPVLDFANDITSSAKAFRGEYCALSGLILESPSSSLSDLLSSISSSSSSSSSSSTLSPSPPRDAARALGS
mmetsp:Transcript_2859/g.6669  ORF Transcript_2859/g.6669 Transcript_2859/m.6669 type:complete len:298 (+) Transcript_2859:2555-3448(+)